jgi:hypothetical protein
MAKPIDMVDGYAARILYWRTQIKDPIERKEAVDAFWKACEEMANCGADQDKTN